MTNSKTEPKTFYTYLQCKDKWEGGGLMISLVKIAIHKQIFTQMASK